MKHTSSFRNALTLAMCQIGLLLCPTLHAAVTFTVTPAIVSNTYNGPITLLVSGLTNTETVTVQKFLDVNTNGVVDASDWLVQQFSLTDGQAGMVIGGITNFNVPGDTDATAGQITARLNFHNGDFMQNIAGKYAFKLSSPGGHFSPITNLLSVTNVPYAQKFTGNVVSNSTSATLPNAVVLLFPPPRAGKNGPGGSPLAGVVANNSGGYSIPAPPGTYMPVAFRSNYLANFAAPPVLTLNSGQTITTNLTILKATTSISGKLTDANNASIGLPGVLLPAQGNGLLGVSFTDTNGNFTVGVQSGVWGIKADSTSLLVHGYAVLQNSTTASAGQTGVNLGLPKATALFYGSVKDSLGIALPGIDVYANDNNNYLYETDGYADANGNYVAAVVGGLGVNDPWWISVSSDTGPTNYMFSQPSFDQNGGTNINSGTAVQANFTALLATNYLTGNVQANGVNIVGVGVYAYATINGASFNLYTDTDANGNYSFTVGNGSWSVGVNCGGGSDSLDTLLGNGNFQCPSNQNVSINNNNATANFNVQLCNGIQIDTTSLPGAQVGTYYDVYLAASSCNGNVNWSLNDPQNFPPNLSFAPNGEIYGNPNTSGTYNFSVHADDGNGHTANQGLSLNISGGPLQILTGFLPNGTNNVFYSQSFQATGGTAPYNWSIPSFSAPLPPNLTLAANGVLSGTPIITGTTYFDVVLTDAAANRVELDGLALTIVNPPLPPVVITTGSLPNGNVGAAYNAQLGATGGQTPYTWSLALGSANPPPGLSINPNGLISGTPTASGLFNFKVQAMDANFAMTNKVVGITINPAPVLSQPALLAGRFSMQITGGSNQNYTLEVSTDLAGWSPLFVTNNPTANSFILVDPTTPMGQQRFYRILIGP